jgi:hypothetical protein
VRAAASERALEPASGIDVHAHRVEVSRCRLSRHAHLVRQRRDPRLDGGYLVVSAWRVCRIALGFRLSITRARPEARTRTVDDALRARGEAKRGTPRRSNAEVDNGRRMVGERVWSNAIPMMRRQELVTLHWRKPKVGQRILITKRVLITY